MNINYAIVFVSDMTRSTAFYRDVIGLPLKFESPQWTEFEAGATTLALHGSSGPAIEPATVGPRPAGYCRLGFHVPDLDIFHMTVTSKGARCLEPPREEFGVRMALYTDPDGLQLIVAEAGSHG